VALTLCAACSPDGSSASSSAEDGHSESGGMGESAAVGPGFQLIDQGEAPAGVACFAMVFHYYRDEGIYRDARNETALDLGGATGAAVAKDSRLWSWINGGASTVTIKQLYEAAYNLNEISGGKAHYFVKLQAETSALSDTQGRAEQLKAIIDGFLKHGRPAIVQMKPSNTLMMPTFHLVVTGYDAEARRVTYASPLDGGFTASAGVDDFIGGPFYKTGSQEQARWDGAWLGFYHGTALAGDHRFGFENAGYERAYDLHVPAAYTGQTPVPLVLDFHGIYMNARVERQTSGFRALSEKEGFIVAYPEGIDTLATSALDRISLGGQSWNADTMGLQWYSWANLSDVDDVAYAVKVVEDVKRQLAIDAGRVYVSGLSQGGAMALLCAHERGDVFAAAAVVSAALLKRLDDYHPLRPIAVAHFHSYDDATVPYGGNILIGLPPIEEAARRWAVVNGCDYDEPTVKVLGYPDKDHPDVPEKLTVYPGGAEVRMYSLHGPTGGGDPHDLYKTNFHGATVEERQQYITNLAWDFLKRFRR